MGKLSAPRERLLVLQMPPYPLVVDDLNDGGQGTAVLSSGEEDHSAGLHQLPLGGFDIGVTHCGLCLYFCVSEAAC